MIDDHTVFVTWHELKHAYNIPWTRQHVMRLVRQGRFPKPVRLGNGMYGRIAWRKRDLEEWINTRPTPPTYSIRELTRKAPAA